MDAPEIPGIDVGLRYLAATDDARVGGDFYDIVPLGPGRLLVMVGDVCGKSLGAAAQSAVVRYMLRAYAAEGSPGEALSRLNSAVIAQTPGPAVRHARASPTSTSPGTCSSTRSPAIRGRS